jgi:sugar phosphate isomerase/epimerase
MRLLELPARLRHAGFQACELAHAHLPALEDLRPAELSELRNAFAAAGVSLWSLVVDYGDLSSADPARAAADREYLAQWVRVASLAGARYVRVVAGEGSPDDPAALDRAVAGLEPLCTLAESLGVGLLTENFRRLCSTAEACNTLCERLQGRIGLTADFGNFPRPQRYTALAAILPRARSIHAKPECDASGQIDAAEFARCLDLAVAAGFRGAYSVVYEGPGDPWEGVGRVAALIRSHPAALAT